MHRSGHARSEPTRRSKQTTPQIKAGKLRALRIGGLERSPVLPEVSTIAEAGVPSYEALNWWGIVAPARTPQPIIDKVNAAIAAVQDDPATQRQFAAQGAEVAKMTPAEFGAFMVKEMNQWEAVVTKSGIKAM